MWRLREQHSFGLPLDPVRLALAGQRSSYGGVAAPSTAMIPKGASGMLTRHSRDKGRDSTDEILDERFLFAGDFAR